MTDTAIKSRTDVAAPGSTRAFLDTLQREVQARQVGDRSSELVRGVTDDRPALTTVWLLTAATVISCVVGWLIHYFHLG